MHVCTFCTCVHPFSGSLVFICKQTCIVLWFVPAGAPSDSRLLECHCIKRNRFGSTWLWGGGFRGVGGVTSPSTSPREGNLVKSGLRLCCGKLQHMLPVLSAQPSQWFLPRFNEMQRRADTCNTLHLITQRVPWSSAPPDSTMQFTPKSCFCERLHIKVFMSSGATE